jgi:hypothetical protein
VHGEYPSWGRLIHPYFEDFEWDPKTQKGHLLPDDWEIPYNDHSYKFEFAIDWHDSKAVAAVWTCEDRDGNLYVYDEITPHDAPQGSTVLETSELIREKEGWPHNDVRYTRWGDPAMKSHNNTLIRGHSAWQEFSNCGIRLAEGRNKDQRGHDSSIGIVNDFFRGNTKSHPRVFIHKHCTSLRSALKNHYWHLQRDGVTSLPDKKWSDYPVCLKYILQNKSQRAKRGARPRKQWPLQSSSIGSYHKKKRMKY